jgi:putative two-component system response regulator
MCPAALDLCRGMRSNRRTALTPVLMLTSDQSPAREIECIESGVDSVLGWPFDSGVLCARVGSMLRRQAGVDALEDSEMTLAFLAQAVDERDNLTASHCNRMSPLCVALGMAMGLSSEHLLVLHRGGYMHDIGRLAYRMRFSQKQVLSMKKNGASCALIRPRERRCAAR